MVHEIMDVSLDENDIIFNDSFIIEEEGGPSINNENINNNKVSDIGFNKIIRKKSQNKSIKKNILKMIKKTSKNKKKNEN
jgi:hypothetical protein